MKRRVLSFIVILALVFSMSFGMMGEAYAEPRSICNVNEATRYVWEGKLEEVGEERIWVGDPIYIEKGTLYNNGVKDCEVYVISIIGLNFDLNNKQTNNLESAVRASFHLGNAYLEQAKKEAVARIPENSNVVVIGHSLGGMIAQQFSADARMKSRYNILNTLAIGAPYIASGEGALHRMFETRDVVCILGISGLKNFYGGTVAYEYCPEYRSIMDIHLDSYRFSEKWAKYDVFGVKNGTHKIVFDEN